MKKWFVFLFSLAILPTAGSVWAAQEADAPQSPQTGESKPAPSSHIKRFAGGVKQVAYEGPKDFAEETVSEVPRKNPIEGIVEGVNAGTQKLLDNTVKGAYKVATFGHSELDHYEIEEPKKGSDETTKIKIRIPGT